MKTSNLSAGAIAFGSSGKGYPVIQVESDQVTLDCPGGYVIVPLASVVRWEPPPQSTLKVGDRVRKIRYIGWTGLVTEVFLESADVLWHLNKSPTREKLSDIELNEVPRFHPDFP